MQVKIMLASTFCLRAQVLKKYPDSVEKISIS